MKIAFISSGSSIHVKKIANELANRGYEITLYTLPDNDKLLSNFEKRVQIVKLPIKGKLGYFLNAPFIRRHLKTHPVDIVNSHYASGYGTLARLVGKHPLALAVFGSDVFGYPFRSKMNMRMIIKNFDCADVISSTSQVMAEKIREFYHRERPIYVTPFGVDIQIFRAVTVKKDDCFEIGIIKKIEKIYGYEYLMKAFKLLKEEYGVKNTRLVIYGCGSAVEKYQALSRQLGISKNVIFRGFIQNETVPEALSRMDVVCMPSIVDESFGVAAVEAMACGVPVVASDASGFTEVIEDGVTGFIVPKKDEKALATALYRVYLMSEDKRNQMGQAGINRVHQLYNFMNNMDTYESALKMALNRKKS